MVYTADALVKGKIIPVLLSIVQEQACQLTEKSKEHNCFTKVITMKQHRNIAKLDMQMSKQNSKPMLKCFETKAPGTLKGKDWVSSASDAGTSQATTCCWALTSPMKVKSKYSKI